MAFSTFAVWCNHHLRPFPKHLHGSGSKTPHPLHSLSPFSCPQPLATTSLHSVCMDLPIDLSDKWNHTVGGFLRLAFFTEDSVFEDDPYCSKVLVLIPLYI